MKSDVQLLRDYAERGNEAAFPRNRRAAHGLGLFRCPAPGRIRSTIAGDIAQSVFLDLARKAAVLTRGQSASLPESLAGWLHRATRYAALNHLRDTHRRRRESKGRPWNNSSSIPNPPGLGTNPSGAGRSPATASAMKIASLVAALFQEPGFPHRRPRSRRE